MAATIVGGRSRKLQTQSTTDRISVLPQKVIELILEGMPIKHAVRTSALSKKWRFHWTTISKLVFDQTFYYSLLVKDQSHRWDSVRFVITNILLLHKVPITSFYLYFPYSAWYEVGNFIISLSRKGVKKLTLNCHRGLPLIQPTLLLPSHIYSCVELTHLNIDHCTFNLPSDCRGFPNLISLKLRLFEFENKSFGDFITSCPLLESMTLIHCFYRESLHIRSRSLKHLSVHGVLLSIRIDAQGLETLSLLYTEREWTMAMVLGNVPKIENLSLGGQSLAAMVAPMKLPTPLNFLKIIKFNSTCFGNASEIQSALYLIRSAPSLQELVITFDNYSGRFNGVEAVSTSFGHGIFTLSCLKVVKFIAISGLRPELEMIKSILASSPSLEKIFIVADISDDGGIEISTELMRFKRVSPKAEMIYSELDCSDYSNIAEYI